MRRSLPECEQRAQGAHSLQWGILGVRAYLWYPIIEAPVTQDQAQSSIWLQ